MSEEKNSKQEKARQADTSERYLDFLLGEEHYAIPLLQVKEVIEMTDPTPVPESPSYFKGVIDLRGRLISVIDLRNKLKMPAVEKGPKTAIIILDLDSSHGLGVVVDRVNSVLAFHSEDISLSPESPDRYITGVARREKRLTLILDIKALITKADIQLTNFTSAA
jgi:purine-binding chemotaxis protein CheW